MTKMIDTFGNSTIIRIAYALDRNCPSIKGLLPDLPIREIPLHSGTAFYPKRGVGAFGELIDDAASGNNWPSSLALYRFFQSGKDMGYAILYMLIC